MIDAIALLAWAAAWVIGITWAEWSGKRAARRAGARRCRGVQLWQSGHK